MSTPNSRCVYVCVFAWGSFTLTPACTFRALHKAGFVGKQSRGPPCLLEINHREPWILLHLHHLLLLLLTLWHPLSLSEHLGSQEEVTLWLRQVLMCGACWTEWVRTRHGQTHTPDKCESVHVGSEGIYSQALIQRQHINKSSSQQHSSLLH